MQLIISFSPQRQAHNDLLLLSLLLLLLSLLLLLFKFGYFRRIIVAMLSCLCVCQFCRLKNRTSLTTYSVLENRELLAMAWSLRSSFEIN